MTKLIEIKEKRMNLVKQMRDLIDIAEKEGRSLDEEQYNKIEKDVDALGVKIEKEERLSQLENKMEQREEVRSKPMPQNEEKREIANLRESGEYREAFWKAMRSGNNALNGNEYGVLMDSSVRSLNIGTDAAGGHVVPDEFERSLMKLIEDQNVFRSLATIIQTGSGTREIPVETDRGTATWTGEEAAYTESNATFGIKTIGAHKLTTLIKVSEELMQDSFFNVGNYIADIFARRFAEAEEKSFLTGSGTNQPTGVVNDATIGKTGSTGQVDSVTTDDIVDTYHALRRVHRGQARWIASDNTIKAIRKLKDSDGQYIWSPGLSAAQPDRILGKPVITSDYMVEMGASNKSILFGDYKHYWIADRKGKTMQRLNELYATNGQIGYRMFARMDGKLMLPEAVVAYQNSAT